MHQKQTLRLSPGDVLAAQNARRQPPSDLAGYLAYSTTDQLLVGMGAGAPAPDLDPSALVVLAWNHVALDMTSIDHTTAGTRVPFGGQMLPVFEATYGEQFGPPRTSRAMAIIHLSMFEAANAIDTTYQSYLPPGSATDLRTVMARQLPGLVANVTNASVSAAINEAAYEALVRLYPNMKGLMDVSMLQISVLVAAQERSRPDLDSASRLGLGKQIGAAAAAAVFAARADNKSQVVNDITKCQAMPGQPPETVLPAPICFEPYFQKAVTVPTDPLDWTTDIILPNPLQLGGTWGLVRPFALKSHKFIEKDGIALPSGKLALPTEADPGFQDSLNGDAYGPMVPDPHDPAKQVSSRCGVRSYGGFRPPPGTPVNATPPRYVTTSQRSEDETEFADFWGYDGTALLCAPPRLYSITATSFALDHLARPTGPREGVNFARYLALVNLALADAGVAALDAKYAYHVARPITYLRYHSPDAAHQDDRFWTPLGQVSSNGAQANVTPPFPAYPSGHAVFGGAAFEMISKASASTRSVEATLILSRTNTTVTPSAMKARSGPSGRSTSSPSSRRNGRTWRAAYGWGSIGSGTPTTGPCWAMRSRMRYIPGPSTRSLPDRPWRAPRRGGRRSPAARSRATS